jgi:hypothetical protein
MPNERGGSSAPEEIIETPKGKNYILAIANDAYPDALHNCIRDAESFVKVLTSRYIFDNQYVTFLKNANRKQILDAFKAQVETVTAEDNLVIYYSGHGAYDKELDEGSWVPSGAGFKDTDEFISNADLKVRLSAIKSHHTFLVVDSCYSGALFLSTATRGGESYLEKFPSRWGLASGRLQTVSDGEAGGHSPFATALLNHLENSDTSLSVMQLCVRVVEQVGANQEGQMPIGEPMQVKGHQSGQFVFHLRNEVVEANPIKIIKPSSQPSRGETVPADVTPTKPTLAFDKDRAMKYFTQNNSEAIFRLINEFAKETKNKDAVQSAILIQAEFNELKKNEMMGIVSYQEASLKRNQLNARLLNLIEML